MIGMLHGTVDWVGVYSLVIDVRGVGYEVFCTSGVLGSAIKDCELKIYTYHHVREDDQRLFGFTTRDEHDLFVKFLTVDGVGPKVALAIFSTYSYDQICTALAQGDERFFGAVSGLGKKTAAKIILELKGKVVSCQLSVVSSRKDNDVVDALVALGYAERDVMGVVQGLDLELGVDQQIKQALRILTKS